MTGGPVEGGPATGDPVAGAVAGGVVGDGALGDGTVVDGAVTGSPQEGGRLGNGSVGRRGLTTAVSGLAGAAAMIAAVTVLSRLLGFGRWLVLENRVGHGAVSEAYNAANTLPNVVFEVAAGGALAGAVVPLLAGPLARGLREDVDRVASALLGWTMAVLVPLAVALAAFAGPIADLLDVRSPEGRDLVARFVVVFAVQVPLYGLAVVLGGVLQAQRRFFWPAFAPVLSTLAVIVAYVGYGAAVGGAGSQVAADELSRTAFAWLAWGTTAGVVALSVPLAVPVWRSGVRLRPALRFPPGVGARARALAGAGIGALLAQQAAVLVLLRVALGGTEGTNTVFLYTQAVYLLPYAVLAVPLATSAFPRLAARAAADDRAGLAGLAAVSTRAVLAVSAAGVAALVAAAPAVAALFAAIGTGGDAALVRAMSPALTWMAPGVLGMALVFHVSRTLYTVDRGRAAVTATAAGWLVVVLVALALTADGGEGRPGEVLVALAQATTAGMAVAGVALLVASRAALGGAALRGLPRTLAVLVPGAVLGGVAGRWLADRLLGGLGDGLTGALVGGAGAALLAAAVVAGAVLAVDRGTLTGLRASEATA